MDSVPLRVNMRARRSRRRRPPPPHLDADEYAAAEALTLLIKSGGGFCSTAIATGNSTVFPPKKHQEAPQSASVIVKTQVGESPDTPLPPPYYYCWSCDKVFQSSQALGGHMTIHRVKNGNAAVPDDQGRRNISAARVHECSCCHQTFATGQALGGHKRKHYDGPTIARKAANCNSTSFNRVAGDSSGERSDEGATTSHARPIIDLNLPPPP